MYNNQIITQTPAMPNAFMSPLKAARASGSVTEYKFIQIKPKKQLAELTKVLKAEPKKFLGISYGRKFNLKDRCVVCGTHKVWDASDPMRPTIPLHKVRKGYPMRGTYCDKHSALHRQYEMLEQQIIADEHGLEFSSYIPKPKVPKMLQSAPLTSLRQSDIESLATLGWGIKPPTMVNETKEDELFRLTIESQTLNKRILQLLTEETKIKTIEEPILEKEGE